MCQLHIIRFLPELELEISIRLEQCTRDIEYVYPFYISYLSNKFEY